MRYVFGFLCVCALALVFRAFVYRLDDGVLWIRRGRSSVVVSAFWLRQEHAHSLSPPTSAICGLTTSGPVR
jgi:hypothetical protein